MGTVKKSKKIKHSAMLDPRTVDRDVHPVKLTRSGNRAVKPVNPQHIYRIRSGKVLHPQISSRVDFTTQGIDKLTHHRVAKRDLVRYYALIDTARAAFDFSVEEAATIVEALKGADTSKSLDTPLLDAWIAFDAGVGRSPTKEQTALSKRLRRLPAAESMALIDAAERYWLRQDGHDAGNAPDLIEVGLVKMEIEPKVARG